MRLPAADRAGFIMTVMSFQVARTSRAFFLGAVIGGASLSACSPALNWRETRVPDSGAAALFPCKPEAHVRRVTLLGSERPMHLASCSAAGHVYALSHVDVGDPGRVTPAMQALRALAAENIGGPATVVGAQRIPGMSPHPLAERLAVSGKRPDGTVIEAQAVFFVKATVVYQATVVGDRLDNEAMDTFFAGLRLP